MLGAERVITERRIAARVLHARRMADRAAGRLRRRRHGVARRLAPVKRRENGTGPVISATFPGWLSFSQSIPCILLNVYVN